MSLLPIDTEMQFPHLFVIPASAGSGKTYTLSHRYVQFLLSPVVQANGLRNILAITFTKLAAKEMKERILRILKEAALKNERTLVELSALIALPPHDIADRAEHMVNTIFHHYSDFNVRTIDSFLTTVFTASSLELGIPPNVSIEFDNDALIEQAFRQYSQNLQEGSAEAGLVDELVALIQSNDTASKGFLWNPFSKIVREVRELQKQFGRFAQNPLIVDGAERLPVLKRNIIGAAAKLHAMIEKSTLPVNNYFAKEIARLADGEVLEVAAKGKTKKYFNKFSDDDGAAQEVKRLFAVIRPLEHQLEEYLTLYASTYYQPFVRAISLVEATIRNVKLMEGSVVIDDINRSLAHYLSREIVPEVYLKLGERISHFMIDEFQDTSPIQWKNLYPLIEEALSKQGSLFAVGDTKQSIYGFRGADWHIFRDLIGRHYFPSAPAQVLPLTVNFRSAQVLVDFVQTVFSANVAAAGLEKYAEASGLYKFAQEVPDSAKHKGYVEVQLIDNGDPDRAAIEQRDRLVSAIRDCTARHFSYGDIAVLTQTNADVVEISSWLNQERIPFLSLSTLDIRKRKVIGEIIALLRFLDSPIDNLSFTTFISGEVFRNSNPHLPLSEIHSFVLRCRISAAESYYRVFRDTYPKEWDAYFERLFSLVGYMPLYDLVSETYKTFSLFDRCPTEESALVKLLECVKQFENSGSNSLKDFLSFSADENADNWSIQIPSSVHAVRIMTVHKAKGLGFPVVIVSLREKRSRPHSMVTVETPQGLSVVRVGKNYGERNEALGSLYDAREDERVIDELNKIYVALTRARNEMYVIALYKKKENLPVSLLTAASYGSKYPSAEKEKEAEKLPLIASLYRHDRSSLPIARYEKIGLRETRRGDVIHTILSRIEYSSHDTAADVQTASVGVQFPAGLDAAVELSALAHFLSLQDVSRYFKPMPGRVVLREQDITASNGRLFRMDRVVVDDRSVSVLDFKTGSDEKNEEYQEQVRHYMTMLKELYSSKEIHGALLYVDLRKVVSVL